MTAALFAAAAEPARRSEAPAVRQAPSQSAAVTPVVVKPAPKIQPQPSPIQQSTPAASPSSQARATTSPEPALKREIVKPYPVKHVSAWDSMAPRRTTVAPVATSAPETAPVTPAAEMPGRTKRAGGASKATASDEAEYTEIKAPESNQYLSYAPTRKAAQQEPTPAANSFAPRVLKAGANEAWVQVSPSQTVMVRPGEDIPGLGKVTTINAKELLTDKSRLAVPQE